MSPNVCQHNVDPCRVIMKQSSTVSRKRRRRKRKTELSAQSPAEAELATEQRTAGQHQHQHKGRQQMMMMMMTMMMTAAARTMLSQTTATSLVHLWSPQWRWQWLCSSADSTSRSSSCASASGTLSHRRHHHQHHHHHQLLATLFTGLLFTYLGQWSVAVGQSTYAVTSAAPSSSSSSSHHYIEYNLADYCSEENWSDYPGRHRIRLEKTVKIRRPSIVDFHYNETHRARLGTNGGSVHGPRYSLIDSGARYGSQQQQQQSEGPNFVPYCLLSFTVAERGYRIYAEGFATGLLNGGKDWFTETLHFRTNADESSSAGGSGSFSSTTKSETLSLVFEQLHQGRFSFHLVLTPFKEVAQASGDSYNGGPFDGGGGGGCLPGEYRCRNDRCIQHYLTCDHVNNCEDLSDEDTHCLAKVPTPDPHAPPPSLPESSSPQPPPPYYPQTPDYYPPEFRPPVEVPTFDVNGNRIDQNGQHFPSRPKDGSDVPEYVDVPLPTDYPPPPYYGFTTRRPGYYDTMNGFGGHATSNVSSGGFLEDLFTFSSEKEVTKVVYLVRYLVAVVLIMILIMLVNLSLWCAATKNDETMMAPSPSAVSSPTSTMRRLPPVATSQISVISDV